MPHGMQSLRTMWHDIQQHVDISLRGTQPSCSKDFGKLRTLCN
jgi:hypothetical protein